MPYLDIYIYIFDFFLVLSTALQFECVGGTDFSPALVMKVMKANENTPVLLVRTSAGSSHSLGCPQPVLPGQGS